jgi:hypothetical protein
MGRFFESEEISQQSALSAPAMAYYQKNFPAFDVKRKIVHDGVIAIGHAQIFDGYFYFSHMPSA